MPDVPDYAAGIQHKVDAYKANGIPAVFVYPKDLTGPAWPQKLYEWIEGAGQQALRRYSSLLGNEALQPYR